MNAPAKTSSAAPAAAPRETEPNTAGQAAAKPAGKPGPSPLGAFMSPSRAAPQPPQPSEPLVVLKSGPEHARLVYRLRNSPATNVATTISNLLRQEGQLSGSAGTAAKSGTGLRVAITPETITNSIVISGPPAAIEEVMKLIEALDQRPPQVQIEAEIGEVATGEAKHGEGLHSDGGTSSVERPNTYFVLERPKSMKTIGRARVLTLDNQPTNMQLGENVPQITGVSKNSITGATSSVTYRNVGLILAVQPRIDVKDGKVVMAVEVTDSHLGPESEGIPMATTTDNKVIRSPRIDNLTLQTTVAIPDGKTVMLGSAGRQGNADKELVIVLTPHIIRPEDAKKTGP